MIKFICLVFFLLLSGSCFAQNQDVYLLKNDGTAVKIKDSCDYIRIISEPELGSKLFNVKEYYKQGSIKFVGKSLSFDTAAFEGPFISYFPNGKRKAMGTYKKGLMINEGYYFFPNGKPYLVKKYAGRYNAQFKNEFKVVACFDSLGNALTTDGNGLYRGFDYNFSSAIEEGALQNGERVGKWKINIGQLSGTELYEKGTLIQGRVKTNGVDPLTYTKRPLSYKDTGVITALLKGKLVYPETALRDKIMGEVRISLVVGTNGRILSCETIRSGGPWFSEEITRVLKETSSWIPENIFDEAYMIRYIYSVNFVIAPNNSTHILISPISL